MSTGVGGLIKPSVADGRSRTTKPILTGSSVVGIQYKDGVMLAADTLASYGSLASFKDMKRIHKVGKNTLVAFSGDMSDMQEILTLLDQKRTRDLCFDDGIELRAAEMHNYLTRVLHNKRDEMNPVLVAGIDPKPVLGYVDLYGTSYVAEEAATGMGGYLAIGLLREANENAKQRNVPLSMEEAKDVIENCMRVLVYRDGRALNMIQLAVVNDEGVSISDPYSLQTEWEHYRNVP